jgi:hypothetical protein
MCRTLLGARCLLNRQAPADLAQLQRKREIEPIWKHHGRDGTLEEIKDWCRRHGPPPDRYLKPRMSKTKLQDLADGRYEWLLQQQS